MSRNLTSGMVAAVQDSVCRVVWFCELTFTDSTILRLNSSNEDFTVGGFTWLGNGQFLGFETIVETQETISNGLTIRIDGCDQTLVSLILSDSRQNLRGSIYLGLLDNSNTLIVTPQNIFTGFFDSATINENGIESVIDLQYESEMIEQKRVTGWRYTDASQQSFYPGDKGFQYTAQAEDWSGFWGKAAKVKFIKKSDIKKRT